MFKVVIFDLQNALDYSCSKVTCNLQMYLGQLILCVSVSNKNNTGQYKIPGKTAERKLDLH